MIRNGTTTMGGDRDAKRQKTTEMERVEEKVEKTETAKVDNNKNEESAGSVDFEELRDDLFREAAKLVSDAPSTKIAIFFTPPPSSSSSSSQSDVSMYSFGHPSVNGVVNTFLKDSDPGAPAENEEDYAEDEDDDLEEEDEEDDAEEEDGSSQGFWWEDDKLLDSTNPEELQAAYDSRIRRQIESISRFWESAGSTQTLIEGG
ncbi:PREDICTED: transcription elongation factor spt5-like [Camelina sativa]|uniref:Transcription elongation factor spt5-like n=1 Tax=Camelina sativa TaxID=90675 RepID=A0ABM0YCU7_CAMSA|nr:PREDICTED: transcription elongation factor spt5-like [Camelina sativa]